MVLIALLVTDYLDTKQYPASADRYLAQQQALQPGVVNSGDYQVAQRGVGANMSVDVAAGGAWVAGTFVARQGLYHQVNDGTVNQTVAPADATNPRIDQVILSINDSTVSGNSDTPTLTVVAGAPTAGATLANRSGVDPLTTYGAFLRLADVLVPAASTSVVTQNILDRRPWARGFNNFAQAVVATPTTASTTSPGTSLQDMTIVGEFSGAPVQLSYWATVQTNGGSPAFVAILPRMDGGSVPGYADDDVTNGPVLANINVAGALVDTFVFVPPAGRHAISLNFFGSGSTTSGQGLRRHMAVRELLAQNAHN